MDQPKDKKKPKPGESAPGGPKPTGPEAGAPLPWEAGDAAPEFDPGEPATGLPSWLDIGLAESEIAKFEQEIIKKESKTEVELPPLTKSQAQLALPPADDDVPELPEPPDEAPPRSRATAAPDEPAEFAATLEMSNLPQPAIFDLADLPEPEDFSTAPPAAEMLSAPLEKTSLPTLPAASIQAAAANPTAAPSIDDLAAPAPATREQDETPPSLAAEAPVFEPSQLPEAPPAELPAPTWLLAEPAPAAPVETMPASAAPHWEALPETAAAPQDALAHQANEGILDDTVAAIDATVAPEATPPLAVLPSALQAQARATEEQLIVFTIGGVDYGVAIGNVREVDRLPQVTPLPNVPSWMLGVANVRGDIVSMVDLRAFLGIETFGRQPTQRMLVARDRKEEVTAGLIVDQVRGIRYVAADAVNPAASPIEDRVAPYLRGFTEQDGRLLVLLDLNRLLLSPEMRQFEPI